MGRKKGGGFLETLLGLDNIGTRGLGGKYDKKKAAPGYPYDA